MSAERISARVEGIDVARGVAGLIMIQGHAYHGWASAEAKDTAAYAFTRLLGSLPLPAFLLLAGAAVAWRVDAAARRGEDAATVRRRVAFRGLQIVLWGYVVNVAYALIDGASSLDTLLRADVLHVIGLSIAVVGLAGVGARRSATSPDPRRLGLVALFLGVTVVLVCPWAARASANVGGPARFLVGLVSDVPGVGLMPLVPLLAWFCAGVGAAQWMLRARERDTSATPAGAPTRTLVMMLGVGLLAAVVGWLATGATLEAVGGRGSRAHVAIWWNAVDLAGRGLVVLAAGALLSNVLRGPVRTVLLKLGRRSLVAYVFHIPFCYGVLGGPLRGSLSMLEATVATVGLMMLSYAAVHLRDAVARRPTPPRTAVG